MTKAGLTKASAEPLQGVSALPPSGRAASALEQSAMCQKRVHHKAKPWAGFDA